VEYVAAYETTSCFCMDSQGDELGHWASLASGLHTAMATTTASTRTASGRRRRQLTHVFASSPQEADNIRVSVTYGVRTPTSGRTRFQGESASIADWQANTTDAGQVLASRLFGSQAPVDCCGGGEIMLQAWLD
jgi:hypothetical protein